MADALNTIDPTMYDAPWPTWARGDDGVWVRTDGDAPWCVPCQGCGHATPRGDVIDGRCPPCIMADWAPEPCACDWCGTTASLDDTTDGLCPQCHATYEACEGADNAAAECEDTLEQALCELAAARDAVAQARKAIASARKAQTRALAAHSARYDG